MTRLATAAKYYQRPAHTHISVNISNQLSIGQEFDRHSQGLLDYAQQHGRWNGKTTFHFARCFDGKFMPWFARARNRQAKGQNTLQTLCNRPAKQPPEWSDLASLLRRHEQGPQANPAKGSNADTCMHAAGPIRQSQTTASLIAHVKTNDIRLAATASSAPCLSLFKPLAFGYLQWTALATIHSTSSPWHQHEAIHRQALVNSQLRSAIRSDIAYSETLVFKALSTEKTGLMARLIRADEHCAQWQARQQQRLSASPSPFPMSAYQRYWRKLNRRGEMNHQNE